MLDVCRTIGLCFAYIAMRLFLPRFFNISREAHIDRRAYGSILLIVAASAIGYALSYAIPDPWWANRALQAVTILGVANEMVGFEPQPLTGVIYAPGMEDTRWDLASNTAGMLLSLPVFFFLYKKAG